MIPCHHRGRAGLKKLILMQIPPSCANSSFSFWCLGCNLFFSPPSLTPEGRRSFSDIFHGCVGRANVGASPILRRNMTKPPAEGEGGEATFVSFQGLHTLAV